MGFEKALNKTLEFADELAKKVEPNGNIEFLIVHENELDFIQRYDTYEIGCILSHSKTLNLYQTIKNIEGESSNFKIYASKWIYDDLHLPTSQIIATLDTDGKTWHKILRGEN